MVATLSQAAPQSPNLGFVFELKNRDLIVDESPGVLQGQFGWRNASQRVRGHLFLSADNPQS